MKSFKEFINEKFEEFDNGNQYHHDFEVNQHKVRVIYTKNNRRDNHSYDVDFQVNGAFEKENSGAHEKDGIHILHAVHKSVNDFIREKNPTKFLLYAGHPLKHKIYGHLAQRLSKKYSADVDSTNTDHEIKFRKNKSK